MSSSAVVMQGSLGMFVAPYPSPPGSNEQGITNSSGAVVPMRGRQS